MSGARQAKNAVEKICIFAPDHKELQKFHSPLQPSWNFCMLFVVLPHGIIKAVFATRSCYQYKPHRARR